MDARSEKPAPDPIAVGWSEYVRLPEWGIRGLKAKLDTGARTSALHVDAIHLLDRAGGEWKVGDRVRLLIPLHRRHPDRQACVEARITRTAHVTNTGGACELRPVVETLLSLGGLRRRISLTLTARNGMLFRLILGRRALAGRYRVDPGLRNLTRNPRPTAGRETL